MNRKNNKMHSDTAIEPSRKWKAALYLRVSTEYQIDKDSLPMQRKDLIAYADLILGIQDYEIFEDAGYSGKNTDRPAFQEMMVRVRKREFTHVLVWKIDRISRNLLDFAKMYNEFQEYQVTFVSKNEQFDTSTAIGEAMLKIILVFAELERNMTSERVTATMISRANNGIWNGGRIPFGYAYDKDKKEFSIDEEQAEVCRKLRDLIFETKSLVHTARTLNNLGFRTRSGAEWSPTTVWIIASSPFYTGTYRYNRYKGTDRRISNPSDEWVIVPEHHPAIFTQDEHEQMTKLFGRNLRHKNKVGEYHISKNAHPFQGIVYCGCCGARMTSTPGRIHADGSRGTNHSCPNRRNTGKCKNPTVSDLIIGEFVLNFVLNMINAKKGFSKLANPGDLQKRLLYGRTFSLVDHLDPDGLGECFNMLSRYRSDSSFKMTIRQPRKKRAAVDPEIAHLRSEKDKQERALRRLQDLYLYSSDAMSEKDYLIRKSEITARIEDINDKLGMMDHGIRHSLSDEDFVRQASHLLISKYLSGKIYISYADLIKDVSPEILSEYLKTILDSVYITSGHVDTIIFTNGLTQKFIYKDTKKQG